MVGTETLEQAGRDPPANHQGMLRLAAWVAQVYRLHSVIEKRTISLATAGDLFASIRL